MKKLAKYGSMYLLFVFMNCCIEPFNVNFENFEENLVVETIITDQLKNQVIKLSKTVELNTEAIKPETGAMITIVSSNGDEYDFFESSEGVYVSSNEFAASPNTSYILKIETIDNNKYESLAVKTPAKTSITNLNANRVNNEEGILGLGISVNVSSTSNESVFLRYEFEETYKIVAPQWINRDINMFRISETNGNIIPIYSVRPENEKICYSSILNNQIIITNTTNLNNNIVENFPITFTEASSIKVAERYSILVKQYSQNNDVYKFYETLKSFSEAGNLLSQIQVGAIQTNINCITNENKRVVGIFDISSITESRIFVNSEDFFETTETYQYACEHYIQEQDTILEDREEYVERINRELRVYKYLGLNIQFTNGEEWYVLVPRNCGDCTFFENIEKPDFWVD